MCKGYRGSNKIPLGRVFCVGIGTERVAAAAERNMRASARAWLRVLRASQVWVWEVWRLYLCRDLLCLLKGSHPYFFGGGPKQIPVYATYTAFQANVGQIGTALQIP